MLTTSLFKRAIINNQIWLKAFFCQQSSQGRIVNLVASSLRIDRVIATTIGIGRR